MHGASGALTGSGMSESMPFAGLATLLKAPHIPKPTSADGDVAIIGVPCDGATTARVGAREGLHS